MAKSFEMTFKIGGSIASSFDNAFKRASGNVDDLKTSARRLQQELRNLNKDFRSGKISQEQYEKATSNTTRELNRLQSSMNSTKALSASLSKAWNTTKTVTSIAAVTTAVAATAVAMDSINVAANFESKMSAVQSKTSATSEEMKKLNETAISLGASTSLSASEVAVAMDGLAAKGFNAIKIIAAMPGVISAAEASGEDLALVSDTVATAINIWGLEASEASNVADVLAMSANKSAAGVDDLAEVFKYAGAPASALGLSLEEVASAAGIMTNAGLDGSNAGTALRASLLKLNEPVSEQQKIMNKLGFSIKDSNGEAKSLSKMVGDLADATKDMSDADKTATISKLVGTEAVSGFLALIKAGPDAIDKMTKSLENSAGASKSAADIMKDNFQGSKEQLLGSWESVQIGFATPILPVLQKAFTGVSEFIEGNSSGISNIGQNVADGLSDILEPFGTKKPELTPAIKADPDAFAEYQKALSRYTDFKDMDMGDKVTYMLEETVDKIEGWMSGSGGKAVEKIFTELGEIAAKAWFAAFAGAVTSSASSLADGNIAGAVGMGAAAWMLGGGALTKGAFSLGKKAVGKAKGLKSASAVANTANASQTLIGPLQSAKNASAATAAATAAKATTATKSVGAMSKFMGGASKAGKVAGKFALPLAIATEGYSIIKSDDKKKATAESAGGLAGSLGGAKLGAIIGTAIAPGIGTAIGGLLGGGIGYFAGKWAGGKAVDKVREVKSNKTAVSTPIASTSTIANNTSSTTVNTATAGLAKSVTTTATNVSTFASSLPVVKEQIDKLGIHMTTLAAITQQAPGWIFSGLFGIKAAGEDVQSALTDLASRIRNTSVPGSSKGGRLSYE